MNNNFLEKDKSSIIPNHFRTPYPRPHTPNPNMWSQHEREEHETALAGDGHCYYCIKSQKVLQNKNLTSC